MTKKKNVLQKFGSFYNRLSRAERGQLISLMASWRGPDVQYKFIDEGEKDPKYRTTAKVRAALMKYTDEKERKVWANKDKFELDIPGGPLVNSKIPLSDDDIEFVRENFDLGRHFIDHLRESLRRLEEIGELPPT